MAGLARRTRELDEQRDIVTRGLRSLAGDAAREGLSERQIAAQMGRSQPEVHRLITASAARAADGSRRVWLTARELTVQVNAVLPSAQRGFRVILAGLDQLDDLTDPGDVAEWSVTPRRVAHEPLDVVLQVLVRRRLRARRAQIPAWIAPQPLSQEWALLTDPHLLEHARSETPEEFRELNIVLPPRALQTNREIVRAGLESGRGRPHARRRTASDSTSNQASRRR